MNVAGTPQPITAEQHNDRVWQSANATEDFGRLMHGELVANAWKGDIPREDDSPRDRAEQLLYHAAKAIRTIQLFDGDVEPSETARRLLREAMADVANEALITWLSLDGVALDPDSPDEYGPAGGRSFADWAEETVAAFWERRLPSQVSENLFTIPLTFVVSEPVTADNFAAAVARACSSFHALREGEGVLLPSDATQLIKVIDSVDSISFGAWPGPVETEVAGATSVVF